MTATKSTPARAVPSTVDQWIVTGSGTGWLVSALVGAQSTPGIGIGSVDGGRGGGDGGGGVRQQNESFGVQIG
jgi:hypothetical protein